MEQLNSLEYFKKLPLFEKNRVLEKLIQNTEDLICKNLHNSDHELSILKPTHCLNFNKLFFNFMKDPKLKIALGSDVICQFGIEKLNLYIFKSSIFFENDKPYLLLDRDLYQIQRRDNFRIQFPQSLNSNAVILSKNEKHITRIVDLSSGGIRVESDTAIENINPDEILNIEIRYSPSTIVILQAKLKHRNEISLNVSGKKIKKYYIGFQFLNISSASETQLIAINMDLYRNFFSKLNL